MGWLDLSIEAKHEAVDWVSALAAAQGYAGEIDVVPLEPAGSGMWQSTLHLWLPDDRAGRALADRIIDALDPVRRTGLVDDPQIESLPEKPSPPADAARRIGRRFLLVPAQTDEHPNADAIVLRIVPGPAFGSGLHPATVACLRLIERHAQADAEALDLGSGSGILSVALAKLGARVLALDNDPIAVEATCESVRRNGVEARVSVARGSLGHGGQLGHWLGAGPIEEAPPIDAEGRFDLIVANILARVHHALADDYRRALRSDGRLIVGGFTTDQEAGVAGALADAGLAPLDRVQVGEYVALATRLPTRSNASRPQSPSGGRPSR